MYFTYQIGQPVSEEDFSSADFFMKDPKLRAKEEKLKNAPKPKYKMFSYTILTNQKKDYFLQLQENQ